MIRSYLIAALALALAGALVWGFWQAGRVSDLKDDNDALAALLRAERAKIELLRKERQSDDEIDAIPDRGLGGAVDPRWLLPGNPAR